jgi:PepSY-associated TM region
MLGIAVGIKPIDVKKTLIFVHRWMGMALCLLFLLWFASGIVMMYWDYPGVTAADRLQRLPPLDASRIRLSLLEAYARLGLKRPVNQAFLTTFDGRPAYRFRTGREQELVFADDAAVSLEYPPELALRIAAQWSGQPPSATRMALLTEEDQWTVSGAFRSLRPLYKFTWPNADEVYVSQQTGQVVQSTSRASRLGAYFGAIPHWLYFTPLRKDGLVWTRVVVWTSGLATFAAFIGLIIGVWMYSPSLRYRSQGAPSGIPYRGKKRLHMILGLFFGLLACTWAFSGMLSLDPFPMGGEASLDGTSKIQIALRGEGVPLAGVFNIHPHDLLAQVTSQITVREIEFASFAGEPFYILSGAPHQALILAADGRRASSEFSREQILAVVRDVARTAMNQADITEARVVTHYEAYYLDRHHQRPLPALFIQLNDKARSMYYIDPKTARVVEAYDAGSRWNRWLYHDLHSLNFPWLYAYRPVWDVLMLALLAGGTWLCITSVILAGQVLSRKLRERSSRY